MKTTVGDALGSFCVNHFGDRYLVEVNRQRFETFGAGVVFEQHFGKRLFKPETFYVVMGTDSGLLPRYLARKGLPEGSRYLFVELPEILARIDREGSSQIVYTTPEACLEAAKAFGVQGYVFTDKVELVACCAAEDMFWAAYRDAGKGVRQTVNRYLWGVKSALGLDTFIRRQLDNLAENRVSAKVLTGLFHGKTAVLLAGGPSLDDVLPWLLEHRGQVAVIAVSRVSRRLLEVGITPDILVSVDPNPVNFDVSNEMFRFVDTSLLVSSYQVCPYILGQWGGDSVYWGNLFPWDSPLNPNTAVSMGPTVTNVAFDTALEMGFSQIVLAGVDLCYSRDGRSHARASLEHAIGARLINTDVQVETYGGWLAYTHPAYAASVSEFDVQAQQALKRGCRVVNPAPGAARMEHVQHVSLAELRIEPLDETVRACLRRVLPADTESTRRVHYGQVLDELAVAENALRRIRELAEAILEFGRPGGPMTLEQGQRLARFEKILKEFEPFSRIIKQFGSAAFVQFLHPRANRSPDPGEQEDLTQRYYQAYRDNSAELLGLFQVARRRVETRLLEECAEPEVPCLARQWQQDGQPGRALIWRKRRKIRGLPLGPPEEALLNTLEDEFGHRVMKGYVGFTGTAEIGAWAYEYALSGALHRVMTAYRKKDRTELECLIGVFAAHPSPKAKPLGALARGYLEELQEEDEKALDHYQEALDTEDEPLQEEALRSIAFLCLKTGATADALLALQHLAERSLVYLPIYGDTLRAVGEMEQALEVYATYLEQAPDDQAAMLNLGCFYRELGIKEGARLMFTHLLQMDPEHRVARMLLEELD